MLRKLEEKMAPQFSEEEKVDPAIQEASASNPEAHVHFAGRVPAGSKLPICVSKNGVNHVSCNILRALTIFEHMMCY